MRIIVRRLCVNVLNRKRRKALISSKKNVWRQRATDQSSMNSYKCTSNIVHNQHETEKNKAIADDKMLTTHELLGFESSTEYSISSGHK